MIVQIAADRQESGELTEFAHELIGGGVDFLRIDARQGVGEISRVSRYAGADGQHRLRLDEGHRAGHSHRQFAGQAARDLVDRRARAAVFQEGKDHALIAGDESGHADHDAGHLGIRVGLNDLLGAGLILPHLKRRGPFLGDEYAEEKAAVADRQK